MASTSITLMSTFHYDEKAFAIDTTKRPSTKKTRKNTITHLEEPMKILRDDNSEPLAISKKKLNGLIQLVEKKLIPRSFHNFYLKCDDSVRAVVFTIYFDNHILMDFVLAFYFFMMFF